MKNTPYIEPEIVAKAKEIDLLTYLRNYEPWELEKICSGVYRMKSYHSLKISNGKWMMWNENVGGVSALDFLIKIKGISLPEAVEKILGQVAIQPPIFMPSTKTKSKLFVLPQKHSDTKQIEKYLLERGIDSEIIRFCIDSGRIYESHYGKYTNVVFVGCDKYSVPRYANSEFIVMLNQASTDRIELAKLLNISDLQMSYITNVDAGNGLIKVGSSLVPFVDKFPRNSSIYPFLITGMRDES